VETTAALVGAKAASVEKSTAPATDGVAATYAETKGVPVGDFVALTPEGRAAVSAEAKAAPVEGPQCKRLRGHLRMIHAPCIWWTTRYYSAWPIFKELFGCSLQ